MARKKVAEEARGVPDWMVTYTDLVTLLFALFVLLFSLSSIDAAKFDAVSSSVRSSFSVVNNSGLLYGNKGDSLINITDKINANENYIVKPEKEGSREYVEALEGKIKELQKELEGLNSELGTAGESGTETGTGTGTETGTGSIDVPDDKFLVEMTEEEIIQKEIRDARQQKLDNFERAIYAEIEKLGIGGYVSIDSQEERLVLRLNSQILFDSGSANLRAEGRSVMLALGAGFRDLDHMIEVQGHTDSIPIRTVQFPSNWELSTQRATNVVRLLQDDCGVPPARLRSTGFGEYRPIADNATPEGRQQNRRIDIIVSTE